MSVKNCQVFLVIFLVLVFSVFTAFGRPLTPPSLIANKSSSLYIPAEPIYRDGFIPLRCNLLLTASEDTPNVCAISTTVIISIDKSIAVLNSKNQVKNDKMFRIWDIYYTSVKENSKNFQKFLKFFVRPLTIHTGGCIFFICSSIGTIEQYKKRFPEALGIEKAESRRRIYYDKSGIEKTVKKRIFP